jgi:hypothetical protein
MDGLIKRLTEGMMNNCSTYFKILMKPSQAVSKGLSECMQNASHKAVQINAFNKPVASLSHMIAGKSHDCTG